MTKSKMGRRDFLKGLLAVGVITASGVAAGKIQEVRNELVTPSDVALSTDLHPAGLNMSLSEIDRAIMWTPESPNQIVIHHGGRIFVSGDYSTENDFPSWKQMSRDTLKLL